MSDAVRVNVPLLMFKAQSDYVCNVGAALMGYLSALIFGAKPAGAGLS